MRHVSSSIGKNNVIDISKTDLEETITYNEKTRKKVSMCIYVINLHEIDNHVIWHRQLERVGRETLE